MSDSTFFDSDDADIKEEFVSLVPEDLVAFMFVGISKSGDRMVLSNMNEPSICLQADLLKQEVLQEIMMRSAFPNSSSSTESTH